MTAVGITVVHVYIIQTNDGKCAHQQTMMSVAFRIPILIGTLLTSFFSLGTLVALTKAR